MSPRTTYHLHVSSLLAAPRDAVWRRAASWDGVNAELAPLHMSAPRGTHLGAHTPTGVTLLRSVVTLARIVPIDVHVLRLRSIDVGRGFDEDSRSLLQARWRHVRRLADAGHREGDHEREREGERGAHDGITRVDDEITFVPRFFGPIVASVVARVFARRHAALRRTFGEPPGAPPIDVRVSRR